MPLFKHLERFVDLMLGTDKAMRIRTSQFLLAALLMVICVGLMYLVRSSGTLGIGNVDAWAFSSCAGLVVIYTLIRSGFSLSRPDPSLAFWQMLFAIACDAVAFVISGQGRGIALPILAVILMFGMFGLSMQQVVLVALYGSLLFGMAAAYVLAHLTANEPAGLVVAYGLMVLVVFLASTFLTWRLLQITAYIRKQRNEIKLALERIQEIATRDELTGLFNRRFVQERMSEEASRSDRDGQPLLIAILDIDHFKRFNDDYGHHAGDVALYTFAKVVQANVRGHDVLGRWGGEEFVILLPNTTLQTGMDCLERIREKVEITSASVDAQVLQMTVSIGLTEHVPNEHPDKTMARADAALYAAKAQGRNQLVASPPGINYPSKAAPL